MTYTLTSITALIKAMRSVALDNIAKDNDDTRFWQGEEHILRNLRDALENESYFRALYKFYLPNDVLDESGKE